MEFSRTSDLPYDQNKYKMVFKNGKAIIYEDYEMMRAWWYKHREHLSHVEVVPRKHR